MSLTVLIKQKSKTQKYTFKYLAPVIYLYINVILIRMPLQNNETTNLLISAAVVIKGLSENTVTKCT